MARRLLVVALTMALASDAGAFSAPFAMFAPALRGAHGGLGISTTRRSVECGGRWGRGPAQVAVAQARLVS